MKHIIGFPGLTDNRFVIDRAAFDLGKLFGSEKNHYIYWYALIIVFAMIVAYIYFLFRAKKTEGIHEDHSMNLVIFAIPFGIIGARVFYVLTNLDQYHTFKQMLQINKGGLAIYGGIIFGLITILVYCRIKKLNCLKTLDAAAPAVMIAQAIGRWGNFFNAEAYGSSEGVKNFLFRMSIADYETPNAIKYVHPTFLYESLWNVLGFVVANIIYRKKKVDGQIFCFYLAWYGIGRGFIELLRTDSCMIFGGLFDNDPLDFFGTAGIAKGKPGLKAFVYLSILLIIASVVIFVLLLKKKKGETDEIESLKTVLAESSSEINEETTEENAEEFAEENSEENAEETTNDFSECAKEENSIAFQEAPVETSEENNQEIQE